MLNSTCSDNLVPVLFWSDEWRPQWFAGRALSIDDDTVMRVVNHLKEGSVLDYYMGYAECRICGAQLGCSDLTDGTFIWPEQAEHYIIAHKVWVGSLWELSGRKP